MNLQFCAYTTTATIYFVLSVFFAAVSLKKFHLISKNQLIDADVERQSPKNSGTGWTLSFSCAFACGLTALWAFSTATNVPDHLGNIALEILQLLGWLWVLFILFGRFAHDPQMSGLYSKAGIVILLTAGITLAALFAAPEQLFLYNIYFKIIIAVMTLVIAENIYRNAPTDLRWHLNFICISISAMATFSLLLYGEAALKHASSGLFINSRAIVYSLLAPVLILGERRQRRWYRRLSLSRAVVFYTTALLLSGSVLFGFGMAGALFRGAGMPFNGVLELALLFCGGVCSAILMTSGSARSRLKNLVINHFFSKRFDYQFEWARCLGTLRAVDATPLEKRAIRTLCDCVDSPSGVLLLRTKQGDEYNYLFSGAWNWPEHELKIPASEFAGERHHGNGDIVADLREGTSWKHYYPDVWLIVPLFSGTDSQPMGVILLAQARAPFALDDEVFDLLRIVASEISLVLSERRAVVELEHVKRFEETSRRLSFVAHDMKNLSSQLSVLLKNAEAHMDNVAFRHDMLLTLHGSLNKINAMLKKMNAPAEQERPVTIPAHRLPGVASTIKAIYCRDVILVMDGESAAISIDNYNFDVMVMHLIHNAIEASAPDVPVKIALSHKAETIEIDIIDYGIGMTDEFVRERLFHPFTTFKVDGYGLGAYQARELARAAGGDITVKTSLGEGTTMHLVLPKCGSGNKPLMSKIAEKT